MFGNVQLCSVVSWSNSLKNSLHDTELQDCDFATEDGPSNSRPSFSARELNKCSVTGQLN